MVRPEHEEWSPVIGSEYDIFPHSGNRMKVPNFLLGHSRGNWNWKSSGAMAWSLSPYSGAKKRPCVDMWPSKKYDQLRHVYSVGHRKWKINYYPDIYPRERRGSLQLEVPSAASHVPDVPDEDCVGPRSLNMGTTDMTAINWSICPQISHLISSGIAISWYLKPRLRRLIMSREAGAIVEKRSGGSASQNSKEAAFQALLNCSLITYSAYWFCFISAWLASFLFTT